jgi:hypothetical protein
VILIGGAAMLLLLALGRLFRIRELQQALQRLAARVRR